MFQSVRIDKDEAEHDMVMIQPERKPYTFGNDLSSEECTWLVQEIKACLIKSK